MIPFPGSQGVTLPHASFSYFLFRSFFLCFSPTRALGVIFCLLPFPIETSTTYFRMAQLLRQPGGLFLDSQMPSLPVQSAR